MLVGLQGSGKTTHAGKLALRLKERDAVRCWSRPTCIGLQRSISCRRSASKSTSGLRTGTADPVRSRRESLAEARVWDSRRHRRYGRAVCRSTTRSWTSWSASKRRSPAEILFVADAMTGQEATNVATRVLTTVSASRASFLTKMDGDTRGGAALSIHSEPARRSSSSVSARKLSALEPFYPDRFASRILGMGDVLTLIEKTRASTRTIKRESSRRNSQAELHA